MEQVYATLRSMGVTVKEVTMPSTKEVQTEDGSMINKILGLTLPSCYRVCLILSADSLAQTAGSKRPLSPTSHGSQCQESAPCTRRWSS